MVILLFELFGVKAPLCLLSVGASVIYKRRYSKAELILIQFSSIHNRCKSFYPLLFALLFLFLSSRYALARDEGG